MKWGGKTGLAGAVGILLLWGAGILRAQNPPDSTASSSSTPTQRSTQSGGAVVEVRIVAEDERVLAQSPAGLPIEIGKPLDRAKVAESLRILYRTGDYADLRALASPVAGGLRLDFVAKENLFFNQVLIQGLIAPPTDASAAAAMQLSLGHPFRQELVDGSLERLREVLREEGLYQAKLTADTVPHPETHQMDVIVHVQPGPRARIESVALKNETEYRQADLLSRLKIKPGSPVTSARIQRGAERIRKFMVKKGHLSARAAVRRGDYDAAKNVVPLELEVSEGPRVKIELTGAKFSDGDLKKLVPVFQEGALDTDLLEEGKRNLRERLERNGYFDAQVNYTSNTKEVQGKSNNWKGTEQIITYTVDRGERHKLVAIEIAGNHYFSTELLRSRLQIFGGAFASRGRFSRRLVEADAQSMRNLYLSNGFLNATADAHLEDDYKGKKGYLRIKFNVQEGEQTRVASLTLEGVHAIPEETLLNVAGSTPGQPYSEFGVSSDRDNILALYFNEGFPEASFTATSGTAKAEATGADGKQKKKTENPEIAQAAPVSLVYHITEGPQTRVRNVMLTGYLHTRPGVIRREIHVKEKEPLREGEVVDSQRRLYNLGVFNRVTIEPQNPSGSDPDKDIVVLVEEAKRYTVAYGGGFEVQRLASTTNPTGGELQAAPRGILELSKLNLTGRADSLSLKLRGSTLQGRALLGYSVPNTFGKDKFSFQATAFAEKTRDINTFTETRYEGSVQLTQQLTPLTTFLYRYAFRKVGVSNLNTTIAPEEIPLFEQPTLVSQFGMTWFRDARDNPADATKGSFNSVDVSIADTGIGSSASFLRFFFQNSTYHPVKRRFSFARSVRIGILQPYRDTVSLTFPDVTAAQCSGTTPPPTLTGAIIPLPERFFAGGGTSLRGFALNQAGPRDPCTGFPVGGQAELALNQEFRFPMRLPFLGTALGGAFFYDGGNVYSRLSRVSFRSSLPKPTFSTTANPDDPTGPPRVLCVTNCSNELDYFAHTIGLGVRYSTPVGPIRVDLGYQLNPPMFVVPCTTGGSNSTTIAGCFHGTRLPHFQIFFNLGASF